MSESLQTVIKYDFQTERIRPEHLWLGQLADFQRDALVRQVEKLKVQPQRAEEQIYIQEKTGTELCTNLEPEVTENESLWNQVEYLTNVLHRERTWRQQQNNMFPSVVRSKVWGCNLAKNSPGEPELESKEMETNSRLQAFRVSYHKIHEKTQEREAENTLQ